MASAKSAQSAVAARQQLEAELVNLRSEAGAVAARRDEARAAVADVEQEINAARVDAARRGEDVDLEALHRRRDDALRVLEETSGTHRALLEAARGVPRQIDALHRREWPAFVELAEAASREAIDAMRELEASYERARAAWDRARATWSEPVRSLDPRADGAGNESVRRGPSPRAVPSWPLGGLGDALAGAPAPRPPGFVPPEQRREHGKPGVYVSASGERIELDEQGVKAYAEQLRLDKRGFAKLVRADRGA